MIRDFIYYVLLNNTKIKINNSSLYFIKNTITKDKISFDDEVKKIKYLRKDIKSNSFFYFIKKNNIAILLNEENENEIIIDKTARLKSYYISNLLSLVATNSHINKLIISKVLYCRVSCKNLQYLYIDNASIFCLDTKNIKTLIIKNTESHLNKESYKQYINLKILKIRNCSFKAYEEELYRANTLDFTKYTIVKIFSFIDSYICSNSTNNLIDDPIIKTPINATHLNISFTSQCIIKNWSIIKHLTLKFVNPKGKKILLSELPNIEYLKLNKYKSNPYNDDYYNDNVGICLDCYSLKLETLYIKNTLVNYNKFFKNLHYIPNLKHLYFNFVKNYHKNINLSNLQKLESLTLVFNGYFIFPRKPKIRFPASLKKITIIVTEKQCVRLESHITLYEESYNYFDNKVKHNIKKLKNLTELNFQLLYVIS